MTGFRASCMYLRSRNVSSQWSSQGRPLIDTGFPSVSRTTKELTCWHPSSDSSQAIPLQSTKKPPMLNQETPRILDRSPPLLSSPHLAKQLYKDSCDAFAYVFSLTGYARSSMARSNKKTPSITLHSWGRHRPLASCHERTSSPRRRDETTDELIVEGAMYNSGGKCWHGD